jgi:cytochrome o ubiquinol oxidase subunit 3
MTTYAAHQSIQEETYSKTLFGFWIYLMTDCMLFATLFATYAVLHNNTFGGPNGKELLSLPYALGETMFLLMSSFTCGLGRLCCYYNKKKQMVFWFAITFLLGASFIFMELKEFIHLVQSGHSWQLSAFLSAFFTLVGTHGLHVSIGLLWMIVLVVPVIKKGVTPVSFKRISCLALFWHFLDVVWIFIFTFVYLVEAM